ncbi:MAG: SIS domain-containing protein [Gemmatimonadota bacterium]
MTDSARELDARPADPAERVRAGLARRTEANTVFFEAEAERTARLCHRMAERFARDGRLVALGASPAARSDARHVAVEFVHPVIVGKRALPAIGLAPEGGPLSLQARLLLEPEDVVIAFGPGEGDAGETEAALATAREKGCLTIAYAESAPAEWAFGIPSEDPFVRQEVAETHYHILWELVHVFFEHRGLLEGRQARQVHDPGDSRFLYPFLGEEETDLDAVLRDVEESVRMKAEDVGDLRRQTLTEGTGALVAAAEEIRRRFEAGGTMLAFGNGGSATDAMDVVADFVQPPRDWPSRPAVDLTADPAILTAIANDVGTDAVFSRQVIAYGRAGDVALALSTSGNSRNVIEALAEARRRELLTVAFVGYDGGRVAAERLADHVIVTRSEHIPRIQEAQASAYHVLRELVEAVPSSTNTTSFGSAD